MQEMFAVIHDSRHPGHTKHRLSDLLFMVMCAVICGLDKISAIHEFLLNRVDFFHDNFGIRYIPSKATISRVLSVVDGRMVSDLIIAQMKEMIGEVGDVIAVDGKAIRSTAKADHAHSFLQIVTAYLTESGVIIGQEKIYDKTNEIPVLQKMLTYMNIKGKTVTADAMHCQKETCKKVIENEGDYIFGLKGNQKTLYDDVSLYFEDAELRAKLDSYTQIEKNKGRIEQRTCRKLSDIDWLQENHNWPGLKSVFSVERMITTNDGTTNEIGYYITSSDASPERLLLLSREHWKVESMHWMLDVVFSEDDCMLESEDAHITLNAFRKHALALHKNYISKHNLKGSIKANMMKSLINEAIMLDVIRAT